MAVVVSVPWEARLQLRLVGGSNTEKGANIVKSKNVKKMKSAAIEKDAYDVATSLVGLQKYPLNEIRFEKEFQLTE